MKKHIRLINIILILTITIGDIFYMIYNDSLLIKSIISGLFVLLGVINLVTVLKNIQNKRFAIIMLIGLTFAMLGDIVLELHFILGAGLFAVGHAFFFVAYCYLIKFRWKDLIYGSIIFVPATLFIIFAPIFNFGGIVMEIVCIAYALIISCMVGKAISNYINHKSTLTLIIMIGSILFMVSDFMLLLNVFADLHRIFGILCLATYYPAECILAYSILKSE